jgi:gas vesicle protein
MSEKGNFAGGFVAGAMLGGVVGGVIGALLASRSTEQLEDANPEFNGDSTLESGPPRRSRRRVASEERIEAARRSLEGKIAQLNAAIDDVRQQLDDGQSHQETSPPEN